MENKHKPGPWELKQTGDGKAILINKGYVGEIHSDDIDTDEAWANAKLIAASPDLLKAARDLCGYFACMMEDINVKEYVNAVNAIKKATE